MSVRPARRRADWSALPGSALRLVVAHGDARSATLVCHRWCEALRRHSHTCVRADDENANQVVAWACAALGPQSWSASVRLDGGSWSLRAAGSHVLRPVCRALNRGSNLVCLDLGAPDVRGA